MCNALEFSLVEEFFSEDPNELSYLIVGYMIHFGGEKTAYELEVNNIMDLGRELFRLLPEIKITLWAYGHTDFPFDPDLNRMSNTHKEFNAELGYMKYRPKSNPLTATEAIKIVNELPWDRDAANCLIFITAQ
ncbi:hypothetical protein Aduo_016341 [Ancylostoma duodenale]